MELTQERPTLPPSTHKLYESFFVVRGPALAPFHIFSC